MNADDDVLPTIFDVTDASFENDVLERSKTIPVVVDFWAPWCGPCVNLAPILKDLIENELAGSAVLAKVNTDENPAVAEVYRIQGIPAVKVIRNDLVVAEFVGALPKDQVLAAIRSGLPTPADDTIQAALALHDAGDSATAEANIRAVLKDKPLHPEANLALARILEDGGDLAGALDAFERSTERSEETDETAANIALLKLRLVAEESGDENELAARLEADPNDLEARYAIAVLLASRDDDESALDHLLEIVSRDRAFRDDVARKTILTIFERLGPQHALVSRYRTKLSRLLY